MTPAPAAHPAQAEAARDLRARRAAALAHRGAAPAGAAREGAAYLVCACGPERYGLALPAVAQVLPMRTCTPVPGAAPALLGLVALSGRIVGVLGLARALGRPEASPGEPSGHLVVLRGERPLALYVDRALVVARAAAPEGPEPDGLGNASVSRYAPAADGGPDFVALDLPRLLRRAIP